MTSPHWRDYATIKHTWNGRVDPLDTYYPAETDPHTGKTTLPTYFTLPAAPLYMDPDMIAARIDEFVEATRIHPTRADTTIHTSPYDYHPTQSICTRH